MQPVCMSACRLLAVGLHARPPAAYLPDACLLPVVSLSLSLTSVLIPSVFLPPILLDSAPHPLYTVYTTKCRQKSTKQNAISRKRNTACLYDLSPVCLSACRLTACGLPARTPAAYLPGTCPPACSSLGLLPLPLSPAQNFKNLHLSPVYIQNL